jgi:hypothetical protein
MQQAFAVLLMWATAAACVEAPHYWTPEMQAAHDAPHNQYLADETRCKTVAEQQVKFANPAELARLAAVGTGIDPVDIEKRSLQEKCMAQTGRYSWIETDEQLAKRIQPQVHQIMDAARTEAAVGPPAPRATTTSCTRYLDLIRCYTSP